jgi:hypothetical protein
MSQTLAKFFSGQLDKVGRNFAIFWKTYLKLVQLRPEQRNLFCQMLMNFLGTNSSRQKLFQNWSQYCAIWVISRVVYFQTKNPNLGKFGRVLQWKMLVYFIAVWSNLRPFGIIYGHLVYFMVMFSCFGMLYQEESGNPGHFLSRHLQSTTL